MEKEILMNQQENDKAEVMLQMIKVEYGAMREEINSAHSHIFTTIEISSATITALLAFLSNLQVNSFIFHFFLIVVIPWVCASSTLIILSESQRMKRAGDYICILEEKVKNLCAYENESRGEGKESWRRTQEKIEMVEDDHFSNFFLRASLFRTLDKRTGSSELSFGKSEFFINLSLCINIWRNFLAFCVLFPGHVVE